MKSKNLRKALTLFAFVAFLASFSSCNRGYGCPNNFSVNDTAIEAVKAVVNTIVKD